MNLFLGKFIPSEHKTPLWSLQTDVYLHMDVDVSEHRPPSSTRWWENQIQNFEKSFEEREEPDFPVLQLEKSAFIAELLSRVYKNKKITSFLKFFSKPPNQVHQKFLISRKNSIAISGASPELAVSEVRQYAR